MTALHSDWAPSAMGRILSCPASVEATKMFAKEDSEASNLGTIAHGVLEDSLVFGIPPEHEDPEIVEGVTLAVEWAEQRLLKEAPQLHVELKMEMPGTPVWGTSDLVFVHPEFIEVADYKHGYLPVEVSRNPQMLTYLDMAIAKFGERPNYYITVIQPRYDHIEGPIRSRTVPESDLEEYRGRLAWALDNQTVFAAGKHCKYCPAWGSCREFQRFLAPHIGKALHYELTEEHLVSNETMAELLDLADLVPGWIKALRAEAMRRKFQDRHIPGYKIVTSSYQRDWDDGAEDELPAIYEEVGIPPEALYEKSFVSPATVEKHIKAAFKGTRNKWKEPFAKIETLIKRKRGAPSLVKDIDGRPAYRKGQEFGELKLDDEGDILI